MDVLTIKGVSRKIDGNYDCDIAGLIDVSSDEALTVREAQFIRDFSGARGGEIVEAFLAGDMTVRSAIAMVILKRNDLPLLESTVMDMKAGWARFELGVEEESDPVPPTAEGETPSLSGGTISVVASESREDDLRVIGVPA